MYSWHRAVGLWVIAPALVTIGCGAAMVFSSSFGAEEPPRVSAPPAGATPIAMITAIDRARRLFPQAAFSGVQFPAADRSEEHTSELQSLMRSSYAVFCLKKKKT